MDNDSEDAGYDSDNDEKPFNHLARPSAVRPRLLRAGTANRHPRLLQSQEQVRTRSRSLLARISPPVDASTPVVVTPPLPSPPSRTLVRADRPTKIELPPPSLPKAAAHAHLGCRLPCTLNVARRAVSESMPVAPRLCATPDEPRSPSALDLPSPLSVARHPSSPVVQRGRSSSVVGLVARHSPQLPVSPALIPPRLLRRLATNNVQLPAHLPCTPRRVFQQQRSALVPRDAPPRPALWKKPDTPVDDVKSAAADGERNPYFDSAIIVPGVGAFLDPKVSSTSGV